MEGDPSNTNDSPDIFDDSENFMDVDIASSEDSISPSSWRGASIQAMYGGAFPWSAPEFPKIVPGFNHAVLYHISASNPKQPSSGPPVPQLGREIWDKDHVRMPYSLQNLYPVEEEGKSVLKNRWNIIKRALSKPIRNSDELEAAIYEYNTKGVGQKKLVLVALHKLFKRYLDEEETEYFFAETLPMMIDLALKLPQILPNAIPLLRQDQNKSVSLSQLQIASLLANAFFCTFPRRNTQKPNSEYSSFPNINFFRLFQSDPSKSVMEKIKCVCHYFRRVCKTVPSGVVTFTRNSVSIDKCPEWSKSNAFIGSVPLYVNSKGTIEDDGVGLLQVDFANRYLGGGVLGQGCVQEEIRFVICPELLISMLFTEMLKPTEALLMIGCERYCNYEGYANTFKWSSNHVDTAQVDSSGRLRCAIIAIDALPFMNPIHQYKPEMITRELNKAYVGFSVCTKTNNPGLSFPGVATGNWGCGAYRGSPYMKSLIQLMACCVTKRPMAYFTFGDEQVRDDIINMYNFLSLHNVTVGDLYKFLCKFNESTASGDQLYPFLMQMCNDKENEKNENKQSLILDSEKASSSKDNVIVPTKKLCDKGIRGDDLSREMSSKKEKLNNETIESNTKKTNDLKINENESQIRAVLDQTCIPSNSKSTLFDSISYVSETTENTSKRESPMKKRMNLAFFEKTKNTDTNSDKKVLSEPPVKSSNKNAQEDRLKNEPQAKKTGKISDYFQRLQKH